MRPDPRQNEKNLVLCSSCESQSACQGYELKTDNIVTAQALIWEERGHKQALSVRSSDTKGGNIGQNVRVVVLLFSRSVMEICLL